jgi:hypothetical protein
MSHYEYRLLEVHANDWNTVQERINTIAKEGFRYRDTISKGDGSSVLVFEREAKPEVSDAWSAARMAMTGKKPTSGKKGEPDAPKYPPEEDE